MTTIEQIALAIRTWLFGRSLFSEWRSHADK